MKGFNDDVISAEDIEAFIQNKAPISPMLNEDGIGDCFAKAGVNNNVNPAFLVATAYLEGGFGTLKWANMHPECHNTFGYAVNPENESTNNNNCMGSWCAMVRRVASIIANGNSYYKRNLYSINQVRTKYSKNSDSRIIGRLDERTIFLQLKPQD